MDIISGHRFWVSGTGRACGLGSVTMLTGKDSKCDLQGDIHEQGRGRSPARILTSCYIDSLSWI